MIIEWLLLYKSFGVYTVKYIGSLWHLVASYLACLSSFHLILSVSDRRAFHARVSLSLPFFVGTFLPRVNLHMEEVRRTPLVQPCHGFQQECRGMSFGIGFVSFIWSLRDLSIVVVSNLLVLGN